MIPAADENKEQCGISSLRVNWISAPKSSGQRFHIMLTVKVCVVISYSKDMSQWGWCDVSTLTIYVTCIGVGDVSSAMLEHFKRKHLAEAGFTMDPALWRNAAGWCDSVGVSLHGP